MGLTTEEAKKRLIQFGPNEIIVKKRYRLLHIFFSQFRSILMLLLIIAALAAFLVGDSIDGAMILLIVFLNAIFGFAQEYRAEKAVESLKKMAISTARVIRDGKEQEILSTLLVPGDIIILEEGDKVPADAKITESFHLEINEASLTGESLPVEKAVFEEENSVFLGTVVTKGRGMAEVLNTGLTTRFGQIAKDISEMKDEATPFNKKLDKLGWQMGILALLASTAVFIIGIMNREPFFEMVLTGISLAVAAVPEGLPTVITVALAVGVHRMAKQKAIMRKLAAIETLGSTTTIATDKTGTITKNEMRVVKSWPSNNSTQKAIFHKLLLVAARCNTANLIFKHDEGSFDVLGDPTEGALLIFSEEMGLPVKEARETGKLVEEYAFDPTLKIMSVIWQDKNKKEILTKGAPETILAKSSAFLTQDGEIRLTEEKRKIIESAFEDFAKEGLRVIAFAFKQVEIVEKDRRDIEKDLVFLGLVGMADPPRPEVKEAVRRAASAGIRTVMITGDNELTANAIATQIGLIKENEEIITGAQLDSLSDEEVLSRLNRIRVFARVAPSHKLRIVKLLQRQKEIVVVTGDGVNDAPAIKKADVGVAMGLVGTDVAKEASDMILTDDNYATLVSAVEEGRVIFDNIKAPVKYLIGCNVGEILAVLGAALIGLPIILTPLQILYINLITDGLPAIVLAVAPRRDGLMRQKPRRERQFFLRSDLIWMIEVAAITAITTVIAFLLGFRGNNLELGRAMAFTTIILVQQFILIDIWLREDSILKRAIFLAHPLFLLAFLGPLVLQPFLLYVPLLMGIFKITTVSLVQLSIIIVISLAILFLSEVRKAILRGIKREIKT